MRATPVLPDAGVPRLEATARRALPRFGIAPTAPVTLVHHRENAVFRVDDPGDGRAWALRVHRDGLSDDGGDPLGARVDGRAPRGGRADATGAARRRRRPGAARRAARRGAHRCRSTSSAGSTALRSTRRRHRPSCTGLVGRTSALIQRHGRQLGAAAGLHPPDLGRRRPHRTARALGRLCGARRARADCSSRSCTARRTSSAGGSARSAARADRFGLTHGDLMPDNILVADGVPHVIDFDDGGYCWYLYDLATLLAVQGRSIPACDRVRDAWVAGYRSVAPLPDEHVRELDVARDGAAAARPRLDAHPPRDADGARLHDRRDRARLRAGGEARGERRR